MYYAHLLQFINRWPLARVLRGLAIGAGSRSLTLYRVLVLYPRLDLPVPVSNIQASSFKASKLQGLRSEV